MLICLLGALGKSGDVIGIQGTQANDNSVSASLLKYMCILERMTQTANVRY